MKSKFIFLFALLPLLLLFGCEKPMPEQAQESEQQEYYGKFQKACVRLKVQNNTTDGRKAQVVGDSAAVWKAVRWGTNLHNYDMEADLTSQDGISLTRWDLFDRDTVECIYILGYESVVLYGRLEPDENGIWNGVPGSEKWGFLMTCENMVIVGMYDSLHDVYYDPFSEKPWIENDPSYGWDGDICPGGWRYDTLGYIPNSVVRANRERLIPLFDEGKYSEMMKIMENDYVIYTCTGEEYRELARQGLN